MFQAVTFDTQVIRTNSFDFAGGMLKSLQALRYSELLIVVTDVVKAELQKQLTDHIQQIVSQLDSASKRAREFKLIADGEISIDRSRDRVSRAAGALLDDYFRSLNVRTLSCATVPIDEVMKLYFTSSPPFSSGNKKAEFPDAVSLLTLEMWAKQNDYRVLAISGDQDWRLFCEKSSSISIANDIPDALNRLNINNEVARVFVIDALDALRHSKPLPHLSALIFHIERAMTQHEVPVVANCSFPYECDAGQLRLIEVVSIDYDGFKMLQFDDDGRAATVAIDTKLRVAVSTRFYIYIGGESAELASDMRTISPEVEFEMDFPLKISFEAAADYTNIKNVEVIGSKQTVDFGKIEPDYTNEYFDVVGDDLGDDRDIEW